MVEQPTMLQHINNIERVNEDIVTYEFYISTVLFGFRMDHLE